MEVDGEIFRAVVTRPVMVSNPDYDWTRGYNQRDAAGNRVPNSIPSPTKTETKVYGPYARKGDATTRLNNQSKDGYGNPIEGVHGHVEKANIAWEVVE
jgi:hypothetical protein